MTRECGYRDTANNGTQVETCRLVQGGPCGEGVTVEVHALRDFGRDFYGEKLEVVVMGYLRPEMRFNGLAALVGRIKTDIGLARGKALHHPLPTTSVFGHIAHYTPLYMVIFTNHVSV